MPYSDCADLKLAFDPCKLFDLTLSLEDATFSGLASSCKLVLDADILLESFLYGSPVVSSTDLCEVALACLCDVLDVVEWADDVLLGGGEAFFLEVIVVPPGTLLKIIHKLQK